MGGENDDESFLRTLQRTPNLNRSRGRGLLTYHDLSFSRISVFRLWSRGHGHMGHGHGCSTPHQVRESLPAVDHAMHDHCMGRLWRTRGTAHWGGIARVSVVADTRAVVDDAATATSSVSLKTLSRSMGLQ